jgi:hypothetical protein
MSGTGSGGSSPDAKLFGRRPWADKEARELLNDISRWIELKRPDSVDDPEDPSLADVISHADAAMSNNDTPDLKAKTLSSLMADGLNYQEAVTWYWYRYCDFALAEIVFAIEGRGKGGDPEERRNQTRSVLRVLSDSASKLPDEDPDDIPDITDIHDPD